MTGDPVTRLDVGGAAVDVSLVSMGNPYVFVSAEQLGVRTREELFADDPALFATLSRVREAACALLGWGADPTALDNGRANPLKFLREGKRAMQFVDAFGKWRPPLPLPELAAKAGTVQATVRKMLIGIVFTTEEITIGSANRRKILLLGAGEVGKATVFKQFIEIYGKGFVDQDRRNFTSIVHNNVICTIKTLCERTTPAEREEMSAPCRAALHAVLDLQFDELVPI